MDLGLLLSLLLNEPVVSPPIDQTWLSNLLWCLLNRLLLLRDLHDIQEVNLVLKETRQRVLLWARQLLLNEFNTTLARCHGRILLYLWFLTDRIAYPRQRCLSLQASKLTTTRNFLNLSWLFLISLVENWQDIQVNLRLDNLLARCTTRLGLLQRTDQELRTLLVPSIPRGFGVRECGWLFGIPTTFYLLYLRVIIDRWSLWTLRHGAAHYFPKLAGLL